ncbi:metalloregulator ArsR/SmtB family transcription factor [Nocardiopsis dassonvillei]|uniref:metalloregulator ArsR/SmtB family transcription factor n=1 Tax=Nocardiopsis dassonvillei TaxID=2014 RepID=UPI0027E36DCF|nr:metalloregulator ArsR/SmtB family transcription factor [Nocardiopsis dassonvillei]
MSPEPKETAPATVSPLPLGTANRLASQLKLLADPVRLRLFSLTVTGDRTGTAAGELAEAFDLTDATVSHHLRVLTEAQLIERHRQGNRTFYTPTPAAVRLHGVLPRLLSPSGPEAEEPTLREAIEPLRVTAESDTRKPLSPPLPGVLDPHDLLVRVQERLTVRFSGIFSAETVRRCLSDSYERLSHSAAVTAHLPVLTERFAAERLAAIAQVEGNLAKSVPEVLFVCVHNAGRSQMAAGILRHLAGERVHIRSAGSMPRSGIDPGVAAVMAEIGIDLRIDYPKPLTDDVVRAADIVVTMGCGDACPVYQGKRYLDWEIPEPAGQPLQVVKEIRDDIEQRIRDVLLPGLLSTRA